MVQHDGAKRIAVRVLQPSAASVDILLGTEVIRAERTFAEGFFEALLPPDVSERPGPADYRLRITFYDGSSAEIADTYAFGPVLTPFDLHLLGEGTHYQSY